MVSRSHHHNLLHLNEAGTPNSRPVDAVLGQIVPPNAEPCHGKRAQDRYHDLHVQGREEGFAHEVVPSSSAEVCR